jgi:hypothetical protein
MNNTLTVSGVIKIGSSNPAIPTVARVQAGQSNFVVTRCKMGTDDIEVWSPTEIGAEGFSLQFRDLPISFKRHRKNADGNPIHPGYRAIQIHATSAADFRRVGG